MRKTVELPRIKERIRKTITHPSKVSVLEKVKDEPLSFMWVIISANADFFNFSTFSGLTSWAAKNSSAPVVETFFQSPENATENRFKLRHRNIFLAICTVGTEKYGPQ